MHKDGYVTTSGMYIYIARRYIWKASVEYHLLLIILGALHWLNIKISPTKYTPRYSNTWPTKYIPIIKRTKLTERNKYQVTGCYVSVGKNTIAWVSKEF